MPSNLKDQSVANVHGYPPASAEAYTSNAAIHPPSNSGRCAPTNLQSSVEIEEYWSAVHSWPDRNKTLGNRLHYLYNNEVLSDVRFLVGKGSQKRRIPAHKLILSAGSAVFHAMFNGALATTSLEIAVPDVEPAAFLAVLLFLYTDQFCGDPKTVMMTLYTAKKYAIPRVEKYCVEFIRSNLSSSNAFMLLAQARFFNEPELAAICLTEIDKSPAVALKGDGFKDIDIDTLMLVLKRQTLQIDESKLFEAVVRWSEAECTRQKLPVIPKNQRIVLGKALYLVRFPLMSQEKFAAGPARSGILTDGEIVSLHQYFTLGLMPSVVFEVNARIGMLGNELRARRFKYYECSRSFNSMDDLMSFTVDKRIFLVGFGVYGSAAASSEVHTPIVYINLIRTSSGRVIASSSYRDNCISDNRPMVYPVTFAGPVEIQANTEYTAVANFHSPVLHYGVQDLKRVTVDCDSTKEKVTFQFNAAFNRQRSSDNGYIPEIIFYI